MTEKHSYTVWERLEPLVRNPELTGTLRGSLADPLWLLSRQRQFGEFVGEDAGSPVQVDLEYAQDHLTTVEVGSEVRPYNAQRDAPVETLVEREPVAATADPPDESGETARVPNLVVRVEAGMNFLDRLGRRRSDGPPSPDRFAETYRVTPPDVADAPTRRFGDVFDGPARDGTPTARGLDGHALYYEFLALAGEAIATPDGQGDWSALSDPVTAFVRDGDPGFDKSAFTAAAAGFAEWYATLYDEPAPDEDAWDPDRMEYEVAVAAGAEDAESVLEASEYHGGRMDWYDFTPSDRTMPDPDSDGTTADTPSERAAVGVGTGESEPVPTPTESASIDTMPTRARFQGMPASRLWELEDANVDLASVSAAPDDLSRLFLLEFALLAGDDWFTVPIDADVGTVTRVTDLRVTDTFGRTVGPVEATVDRADEWELFTYRLPNHDEPGLFLPPTVGTSLTGETVEDVLFGRDESANLVFGVETTVEGALGEPLDREEFRAPSLEIGTVRTADDSLTGRAAADAESVVLRNPGHDVLSLNGWTLYAQHADHGSDPTASNAASVDLSGVELPPEGSVELVVGGDADLDTSDVVHLERTAPILGSDTVLKVTNRTGLVAVQPVDSESIPGLPDYRIANEVPDNWFPYVQSPDGVHRFELGVLLDRDALSGTLDAVPEPLGRVLDPDAEIFHEEIPRGGRRVTRAYESTAWVDGVTHVWSSREVRPGVGEVRSGLRFDYLDDES